jgi:hypothetical protein
MESAVDKTTDLHVRVSERDRLVVDVICEVYGISTAAAVRVSLRMMAEKLGLQNNFEKTIP